MSTEQDWQELGIVPPEIEARPDLGHVWGPEERPEEAWLCRCSYYNRGPICTHCARPRRRVVGAPEELAAELEDLEEVARVLEGLTFEVSHGFDEEGRARWQVECMGLPGIYCKGMSPRPANEHCLEELLCMRNQVLEEAARSFPVLVIRKRRADVSGGSSSSGGKDAGTTHTFDAS